MNRRQLIAGLGFVLALAGLPAAASASTIPANCGVCATHNTAFNITYQLLDDTKNIYQFVVTATYGASVDFKYINAISFQIDGATKYDATPTVVGPSEDTWSVVSGGLNSNGCDGTGTGFFCANSAGKGAAAGVGGSTDTWTFRLDLGNNVPDFGSSENGSFNAEFTDASGKSVGTLICPDVTFTPCVGNCGGGGGGTVPEPGSMLLVGTGLVGLVARRFRRS